MRELKGDVLNGQDVVIFAPRRYGKSSLVWRAMQELVGERVLIAYVNLMLTPTKEKLAEKLAAAIYEDISSPLERARERALAPFPRPPRRADDQRRSQRRLVRLLLRGRAAQQTDVDATLERLLALPAELGARGQGRVALIFDEFQEVVLIDPGLPKLMRTIFEQQPEVGHVYLGSKRHMMERIFNDQNEPFWRSAKQMELEVIEPDEFALSSAVLRGAPAGHRRRARRRPPADHPRPSLRDPGALLLPLGADALRRGAPAPISNGRCRMRLRSEHAHLSDEWESAARRSAHRLRRLAAEPGHPLRDEYRARHGLPSIPTVQSAIRRPRSQGADTARAGTALTGSPSPSWRSGSSPTSSTALRGSGGGSGEAGAGGPVGGIGGRRPVGVPVEDRPGAEGAVRFSSSRAAAAFAV